MPRRAPSLAGHLSIVVVPSIVLACHATDENVAAPQPIALVVDVDAAFRPDAGAPTTPVAIDAGPEADVAPRMTAADCAASTACTRYGACDLAVDGASCAVKTDASCAASLVCKVTGTCAVVDGACRATQGESCRAATVCAADGRCTLDHGACVAHTVKDCRASRHCKGERRCGVTRDVCCAGIECDDIPMAIMCFAPAKSDTDCVGIFCDLCGSCHEVRGECHPNSDEDCLGSELCAREGTCFFEGGRCAVLDGAKRAGAKVSP